MSVATVLALVGIAVVLAASGVRCLWCNVLFLRVSDFIGHECNITTRTKTTP